MSYLTTQNTNIAQNQEDFQLPKQPPIFLKGLFTKTLDPIQADPTKPRTITVTYTFKNCG